MRINITIDYDPTNQAEAIAVDKLLTVLGNAPASMSVTPIESKQDIPRKRVIAEPESQEKPAEVATARLRQEKQKTNDTDAAMSRYREVLKSSKIHPQVHELLKLKGGDCASWSWEKLTWAADQMELGVITGEHLTVAAGFITDMNNKEYDNRTSERELESLVKSGDIKADPWLLHAILVRLDSWKIYNSMKAFCKQWMLNLDHTQLVWEHSTQPMTRTLPNWKVWMKMFEEKGPDNGTIEDYKHELSENPKAGSIETLIKWIKGQRGNPRTCIGLVFAYNEFQQKNR